MKYKVIFSATNKDGVERMRRTYECSTKEEAWYKACDVAFRWWTNQIWVTEPGEINYVFHLLHVWFYGDGDCYEATVEEVR